MKGKQAQERIQAQTQLTISNSTNKEFYQWKTIKFR